MSDHTDTEDQDAIQQQLKLLAKHRERLALLLAQYARFGSHTPPHIIIEIKETQATLRPIKAWLRSKDIPIVDEPNDDAQIAIDIIPTQLKKGCSLQIYMIPLLLVVISTLIIIGVTQIWSFPTTPTVTVPTQNVVTSTSTAMPVATCTTTISFGTPIQCSLSESGRNAFLLEARAGDQLLIVVARIREINEDGVEPSFVLSQSGGADVADCTASGPWYAEAFCTIPSNSSYVLTVTGKPTGQDVYRVFVQRLNSPVQTTPITLGVPHIGQITQMGQIDTYTFTVPTNAQIAVEVQSNNPNDNKLGPWFEVYQPDGMPVPDCNARDAYHAEATCTLPIAGTYTMLVADGYRQGTEAYTVQIRLVGKP